MEGGSDFPCYGKMQKFLMLVIGTVIPYVGKRGRSFLGQWTKQCDVDPGRQ